MRHPRYCLAHHPGLSYNIANDTHFSTPPTPPTLAHQPPYQRWHSSNGLSPIMNKVFNFQENERHNLKISIHLVGRNMHTAHFGNDTISRTQVVEINNQRK